MDDFHHVKVPFETRWQMTLKMDKNKRDKRIETSMPPSYQTLENLKTAEHVCISNIYCGSKKNKHHCT